MYESRNEQDPHATSSASQWRGRVPPSGKSVNSREWRAFHSPKTGFGALPGASVPIEEVDTQPSALIGGIGATFDSGALPDLSAISTAEVASITSADETHAKTERKLGATVVARLATYGVSLPLGVVTARLLGPHDKGTYTLLLLCSTLFVYCSLGLSTAGIYYVRRKLMRLDEVVGNLLCMGLLLSVLASLAYASVALVSPVSWFHDIPLSLRASIIILGSVALLTSYMSDMLLAAGDMRGYNLANIIQDVTQAGGLVAFLTLSQHALPAAVLAYATSMVIALAVAFIRLGRLTRIRLRWRWSLLRRLFSYGLRSHTTALLNLGNLRLDSFLTSLLVGVTAVGYYAVATSLVEVIWQLPLAVSGILFPLAAGQRTAEASGKLVAVITRRTLLLVVVSCIGLLIASRFLLPALFGAAYLPALVPLWFLLPGMIGLTLYKTLYTYLLARNYPSIGILSTGLALVATLSLDLLLIPQMGIVGAAIASSIAYTINGLVILIAFLVRSGQSPAAVLIPRLSDLSAIVRGAARLGQRVLSRSVSGRKNVSVAALRHPMPNSEWYSQPGFIVLTVGALVGIWAAFIAFGVNLTLFALFAIGACVILSLTNRLWLCAALLIADLTLTDYNFPFLPEASLRLLLVALLSFAVVLAVLQGKLVITKAIRPMLVAIGALIIVSTLSDIVNGANISTFLQRCLIGALIVVALSGLARSVRDIAVVFAPALLLTILSALTGIAQAFIHSGSVVLSSTSPITYPGRSLGLTQTPITLGNELVIASAVLGGLLLHLKAPRIWALVGWVTIGILLFGAYESGSRAVVVATAAAAAVLYLSFYSRIPKPVFFLVIAVGLGLAILAFPHVYNGVGVTTRASKDLLDSGAQRLVLWVAAALVIRDHPLLGIGYGRFQAVVPAYSSQVVRILGGPSHADVALGTLPAHDDFLSMWIAFGVVGFLAFVAIHLLAARSIWQIWHATRLSSLRGLAIGCGAGFAAYIVHESLHNAFQDSLIPWFLFGAMLVAVHLAGEVKRREERSRAPKPLFAPGIKDARNTEARVAEPVRLR